MGILLIGYDVEAGMSGDPLLEGEFCEKRVKSIAAGFADRDQDAPCDVDRGRGVCDRPARSPLAKWAIKKGTNREPTRLESFHTAG